MIKTLKIKRAEMNAHDRAMLNAADRKVRNQADKIRRLKCFVVQLCSQLVRAEDELKAAKAGRSELLK